MNTKLTQMVSGAGLVLIATALAPASLLAGPGAQYWRKLGSPATRIGPTHACSGATLADLTVMQPSWQNRRGPLAPVSVGSRPVCQVCVPTAVATKSAWVNGRGPLVRVTASNSEGRHICASGCVPTPGA